MRTIRPIRIEGEIAYVPLTQGYEAIIDAKDTPLVEGMNWRALVDQHTVYAVRSGARSKVEKRKTIYMHRLFATVPDSMELDHVDGNGLNNRRENLRVATALQNRRNQKLGKRNKVGLKGVSWSKAAKKWQASIRVNNKGVYLGIFETPEEAHAAYIAAIPKYHGDWGKAA